MTALEHHVAALQPEVFLNHTPLETFRSNPAFSPEEEEKAAGDCDHDGEYDQVAIVVIQTRHITKIHPVEASDKTDRHKQRRDHSERFHGFAAAQTDFSQMKITQVGTEFAIRFNNIHQLNCVVVAIAKVCPSRI